MKRFLIRFLTVSLAVLFTVLATGCVPPTILSFNNDFAGGSNPSDITGGSRAYTEELIYDVEYVEKYNDAISKSSTVTATIPKYQGTFVSTFTDTKPNDIDISLSDISNNVDFDKGNIYYLKTVLDLTVTAESIDKTYNDIIVSETCFYQQSLSYAPIWSKTYMKMTFFDLSAQDLDPVQDIYQFETLYNTASYTINSKIYENVNSEDIGEPSQTSQKTYEYTLKTLIDNNQLFFILRNIKYNTQQVNNDKVQQDVYLPTVSFAYGEYKNLHVLVENEETYTFNYDLISGEKLDESERSSIPVNNVSFVLSANEYRGTKKFIKIQKKQKTEQSEFKALPVEYAEPLIDQRMTTYGALKYTLKQAKYN
ncbi:MAG: hypothetical protein E7348_01370 [Clostridiales bacterium]|nr:hypothetical protein [Clostridiales bacterium]